MKLIATKSSNTLKKYLNLTIDSIMFPQVIQQKIPRLLKMPNLLEDALPSKKTNHRVENNTMKKGT